MASFSKRYHLISCSLGGISVDHSTINRWVIHFNPQLENEFRKNHKRKVGGSWRMDEAYIKIKGVWHYLYRAVDKAGNTVDFMLSEKRDTKAAKAFFNKAINANGIPEKVTIDKSGANKAGPEQLNIGYVFLFLTELALFQIVIRQIKYLNNIVEQDHRGIKRIVNPMMVFKSFRTAEATISGIELYRMLKKGQHCESSHLPAFEQFYALAG